MTSVSELEELLYVERIHADHFNGWEKRATHPLAKMAFRLAADKERNHIGWVELMIEIARAKKRGEDLGVSRSDLELWIEDEDGEGESYERLARRVTEPWIRTALKQMGHDEATNAQLLKEVLAVAK